MSALVKICGLRTAETLTAAVDGGADFVGFVFYPRSPRSVSTELAGDLARRARDGAHKPVSCVALLVDADDEQIAGIMAAVAPDLLQLHGAETPARVAQIKSRFGVPAMKAIGVESQADVDKAKAYDGIADLILFDAKVPKGWTPRASAGALPGGNGLRFDWHLLDGVAARMNFMLSGGLDPDNVATAIRLTGAWAVDVSSGVETAPGVKDPALIARFLQAARTAN